MMSAATRRGLYRRIIILLVVFHMRYFVYDEDPNQGKSGVCTSISTRSHLMIRVPLKSCISHMKTNILPTY
jgi:hypothetical protein